MKTNGRKLHAHSDRSQDMMLSDKSQSQNSTESIKPLYKLQKREKLNNALHAFAFGSQILHKGKEFKKRKSRKEAGGTENEPTIDQTI